MSEKQNCWEYKKCGRQPDGDKTEEFGICPAAVEKRFDGVHDGTNAGRSCWVVAGTFCKGDVQGLFARKYATCKDCDFYKKVQEENYNNFEVSLSLLKKLEEK